MSCGGGRIYKGDTVLMSVPFDVEDYTSLSIGFFTEGDTKVVVDNPSVVDGFIECTLSGNDLDLLPNGVVRYVITYTEDGEEHTISTNTSLVLKTPPAYSALTPTDYYLSGYTAGQQECSGGSECNLTYTAVTLNQYSGGEENIEPSGDYDGFSGVHIDATPYGQAQFDQGYAAGQADCPECSGGSQVEIGYAVIDMTFGEYTVTYEAGSYPYGTGDAWSAVTVDNLPYRDYWYHSGYTQAMEDLSGSPCTLQDKIYGLSSDFSGSVVVTPSSGFVGFSSVELWDTGYGNKKRAEEKAFLKERGIRKPTLSGTVTFNQDLTFDDNIKIWFFIYEGNISGPVSDEYIYINGEMLYTLKHNNMTLTAGTYPIYFMIDQEVYSRGFGDFYTDDRPMITNNGGGISGVSFNTKMYFTNYY